MLHYFSPIMEGALPEENTQSTTKSFVEHHNSTPFEIIVDFAQIEPNITIVDNAHTLNPSHWGSNTS